MTRQRHHSHDDDDRPARGFTGFLRSLLAGIPWSESAETEEEIVVAAPAGGVLRFHNVNGKTLVCGEDRADISVMLRKSARAESADAAQELLEQIRIVSQTKEGALEMEVDIPSRWNRRGCANVEIHLPRELAFELSAVNGRIDIRGLRSRVKARSSNGSACITDVVGNIEVATSNAKVCCSGTRGKLVVRSSNGKIEIESHRGSIDASTSNGLIRAEIVEVGKHGVQLATSNGRIVLELPEDANVDVDIRVDNGIIRNDRPLSRSTHESMGRLNGQLGHGGAPVKLRTSNGSVSLR